MNPARPLSPYEVLELTGCGKRRIKGIKSLPLPWRIARLRIEVEDVDDPNGVRVTATAAWGACDVNQGIESCEHVCSVTATDFENPLHGIKGNWAFDSHHQRAFADLFRAGSEQNP